MPVSQYTLTSYKMCFRFSISCVAVRKVPLQYPCRFGDLCQDPGALCLNNLCRCKADYYTNGTKCGAYKLIIQL